MDKEKERVRIILEYGNHRAEIKSGNIWPFKVLLLSVVKTISISITWDFKKCRMHVAKKQSSRGKLSILKKQRLIKRERESEGDGQ